ncbi:dihydrodipicolinate synthase family protein [Microbacterium sp. NEAU-LLC]|uniref:Dihydrodipicolinate synthase family protein n=1 Tax=Microbacterium helvum TaxID=2773713 RepID=A0ABR8NQQ3_9MICO|nr:dihydrodipicolinate synthase family protein [Microbacterium helvum]MBD3942097.1 dihydrodipicolinate synthase family protein [Microbacterium helvum]
MTVALRGVIPPLVTPLTDEGELDSASLERLVGHLADAGVDGLFVGGSSGEVALQTDDVRVRTLQVAVAAAGGLPVLAGAIDTGTARVVEHARRAQDAGAAGVVVTPPFYVAPHPDEIVAHYRAVAAAVDIPVIAYDIPSATHVPLPLPALQALAEEGTIVALKDSSGDLGRFRVAVERVAHTGIGLLTGSEVFADLALQAGATGMVPGLGNVDPDGYVRIQRAVEAGDHAAAAAEQLRLIELFQIVDVADRTRIGFTAGALGAFKAALHLRGVIASPRTFAPFLPLDDAEVARIRGLLVEAGLPVIR